MDCEHLAAEAAESVELARAIEAEDDARPSASRILGAIRSAKCAAIVTGEGDSIGLDRWAVARLMRRLAHRGPAFEIPLGPGILAGGGNAAGAAAVATWRHGAAGAIAAACDRGGRFEPAEADGERLVARGDADLLLVVGGLSDSMRRAVSEATRSQALRETDVVWLGAEPESVVAGSRRTVFVRTAGALLESDGQMLREDGRLVTLLPLLAPDAPSLEDVLARLREDLP
jgi:formylmethanofuran dehydrogenase subunit B